MGQLRNTRQKEIIQAEIKRFKTFFTAEELYEKVKEKKISLATVYRFLHVLKQEGELFSYLCDRRQIYSKEKNSHSHFICEETGKVIHFNIDNLDFLKNKIPGKISSFQIEVKGLCDDCTKN